MIVVFYALDIRAVTERVADSPDSQHNIKCLHVLPGDVSYT